MSRYDELVALEMAAREANQKLEDFKTTWAADCGVKVDTTVTVTGHSFKGKRMVVDVVNVERGWSFRGDGPVIARARGRVIKADGTPGLNVGEYALVLADSSQ